MILIVLLSWIYFFLLTLVFVLSCLLFVLSAMAFSPLGNPDHVFVSISIDFPTNLQRDASFHHIAYCYSRADWDCLLDHLRGVPEEDVLKLGTSAAASKFCEWVQVGRCIYPS